MIVNKLWQGKKLKRLNANNVEICVSFSIGTLARVVDAKSYSIYRSNTSSDFYKLCQISVAVVLHCRCKLTEFNSELLKLPSEQKVLRILLSTLNMPARAVKSIVYIHENLDKREVRENMNLSEWITASVWLKEF